MKPQTESQIQKDCVRWFRAEYPNIEPLFFSVPNGGQRNAWTAKILKDEGARAGVSDLILLFPHSGYASLCIEMKRPGGVQSESQKIFEGIVTKAKSKYVICHSLVEFVKEIRKYLK